MGISEAYGRAIGTNFGFSSFAQSPPPEPELPLPQRRSGALAREGGKRAKLAKPTLRTYGSSMLVAKQHEDSLRFPDGPPRILPRDPQESSTSSKLRGLEMEDLRAQQFAHVFAKGSNSGNPPTPRSGASWACPFINLIWRGRGGFV